MYNLWYGFLHRGLWLTQEAPAALRHKRLHQNCWGFHKRAILYYHILWFCCIRCTVLLPLCLVQHYFESERARIALCQSKLLLCNTISRHVKVKKKHAAASVILQTRMPNEVTQKNPQPCAGLLIGATRLRGI